MKKELAHFTVGDHCGGNQEWFSDPWMFRGGCGAVTACDLCIYLAKYMGMNELYPYDAENVTKADYIAFGEQMRKYLGPRPMGIYKTGLYTDGFQAYLDSIGSYPVRVEGFSGHEDAEKAVTYVKDQIDRGIPVPYLMLLHRDKKLGDYEWHWFLLTGYEEKGKDLLVKTLTYGETKWLSLRHLWHTGRRRKGGFVLVHPAGEEKMKTRIEEAHYGNITMKYFRFGQGEKTMVILPGLSVQSVMGSADAIVQQYAEMADEYTIYVFDRREELPPVYPVQQMAEDTAVIMKSLGLADVCLFGASQGGMMGMCIAVYHPELVGKLALGSTSAYVENSAGMSEWLTYAERKDRTGLYLSFGKALYPPQVFEQYRETLTAMAEGITDEDLTRFAVLAHGAENFDIREELKRITCPVLVIGDEEDNVVGAEASRIIYAALREDPANALYMYRGYGHAAYDTAPDYRQRLLQFFND